MTKIIFKYKNEYFLFASFKRGTSDGSFYWWFERSGKSQSHYIYDSMSTVENISYIDKQKDEKIGISYHTTGCIHYKAIENNPKIYAESLFDIKQNFCFALYSIPSVLKLDKILKKKAKNNIIIDLDYGNFEYRNTFSLTIVPYNSFDSSFLKIDYIDEKFSILLNLENTSLLSANHIQNSFVFMRPNGLFELQQSISPNFQKSFFNQDEKYDQEWALIKYHQKINSTNDLIVYEQDSQHWFRMVFAVPMRIAPKIEILFDNPELTFKLKEKNHKNTLCLFTVIDINGDIVKDSTLVNIKHVSLDAEL